MRKALLLLLISIVTIALAGCGGQPSSNSGSGQEAEGGAVTTEVADPYKEFTYEGITLKPVGYYIIGSDSQISEGVSATGRFALRFTVVESDADLSGMAGYQKLTSLINDGSFTLTDGSGNVFECVLSAAGADLDYVDIGNFDVDTSDVDYLMSLTFQAPETAIPVKLLDEIEAGF